MLLNLKWLSLLKTNLRDAPWSEEEDLLLLRIATYYHKFLFFSEKEFKKNWTEIAIEFNQSANGS